MTHQEKQQAIVEKLRIVEWRDSQIYATQGERDDDYQIATITSVGFLISEDEEKIVLAGDSLGDDVRRVIAIPKENIIRFLKPNPSIVHVLQL